MRIIAAVAAFIVGLLCVLPLVSEAADTDNGRIEAYILTEAQTGTVLDSYNSDKELFCGSLSKLMLLLLVAEDIETGKFTTDKVLTASETVETVSGAVVWLRPGDSMTVDELLKSVITGNANDAAAVLAEASERTVEQFVMRMNTEAFDIGLRDTAFCSPFGYFDSREHTTAHDLAVICSRLARYEFLRPYFSIWRDNVRGGQTDIISENRMIRTYDRHIGFKACHSDQSGYCIAEAGMNEQGTVYISVVLGAEDEDVSFDTAKKLLRRGFRDFKVITADFPDEMMQPVRVSRGEETAAELMLGKQKTAVIPRENGGLSSVSVLPAYMKAPLKTGQKVGTAAFYHGKTLVCETDIIVKNNVCKITWRFVITKMLFNLLG